jgi:hypothetical protein
MVSVLTSKKAGTLDIREKLKTCEWVKLPAPSTTHAHPTFWGTGERPVEDGGLFFGVAVADGTGADLDDPQAPNAD